jgi:PAS domain S-box-containing protein
MDGPGGVFEQIGAGLAAAGVGLLALATDGAVRWVNAEVAARLGAAPTTLAEVVADEDTLARLRDALAAGRPLEIEALLAGRWDALLNLTPVGEGLTCVVVRDAEPLRRAPRRAAMLQAVTTLLAKARDRSEIGELVIGALHDALGASAAVMYATDERDALRLVAARGLPDEVAQARAVVAAGERLPLADAVREGAPIWIEDRAALLARYPAVAASPLPAEALRAIAALPLVAEGRTFGGMVFSFGEARRFGEPDRKAMESIASQCAQALARARSTDAERTARLEAQRRAAVLENVQDSVIVTDLSGRVTYWNEGAERMFGYTAAEMRGRSLAPLYPPREAEALARDLERILQGHDHVGEWEGCRKDGSTLWIDCKTTLFRGPGGEPIGFIGVAKDVTVRRRAEADRERIAVRQQRQAVQLSGLSQAALVINKPAPPERLIAALNEKAREIIGAHQAVTSLRAERDGQPVTAVSLSDRYAEWRGREAASHPAGIERAVCETNRPLRLTQAELEAHPARPSAEGDGRPPMRGWLAAPLVTRDGRNMGLIQLSDKDDGEFTAEDEDILVQLAQMASIAIENILLLGQVRAEKERAEQASRAKDEFMAMLGHELRNPLSPIVTALHLMRLGDPELFARERAIIERQVQHLVRLVDDLLDVSRITRGKVELDRSVVEMSQVVTQAIEMASPLLEQRRHHLGVDVPRTGLAVEGDAHRLAQVVSNLLTNAAKYTTEGGHVDVTAAREGDQVVLRVRDDGVGIDPDLLGRVFDLFAQGEQPSDRRLGGLGLGLTIVRSFVELHGGTVTVHSRGKGHGSEFVVRLPLARIAREKSPPPRSGTGPLPGPWAGRRVLVVDDNQDAADMLALLLRALGVEVVVAYDGPQALRVAEEAPPDAALVDIGLPVMDGYELGRRLLERWPGLPVAALTGYGGEADRDRTRAAGFREHVVKPVALEDLRHVLRRLFTPA